MFLYVAFSMITQKVYWLLGNLDELENQDIDFKLLQLLL